MRAFPLQPISTTDQDYTDLSADWLAMSERANRYAFLKDQADVLHRHVKACYDIYLSIQQPTPPKVLIRDAYDRSLSGQDFPRTPSKRQLSKKDTSSALLRLSQMRQLAEVWRDKLTVGEVADICMGSTEHLKRLKVSCGATMGSNYTGRCHKQVFV